MWTSDEFNNWIKEQVNSLREEGITCIGTEGLTKLLLNRILLPNKILMTELIKPYIKIKRGKKVLINE